jgi:hypothetical protein
MLSKTIFGLSDWSPQRRPVMSILDVSSRIDGGTASDIDNASSSLVMVSYDGKAGVFTISDGDVDEELRDSGIVEVLADDVRC